MVRAAIASFGVPFILGLGALATYRHTKDLFLPADQAVEKSSKDSSPKTAPPAETRKVADVAPAPVEAQDLEEVARRRAEQLKEDQLHTLEPEAIVREWLAALAEKQKDAANAVNQQALAAAAGQFASVFLTKSAQDAALADIRGELDYDVLDKCLASLAELQESSLREDLDAYIRSKVVKLAEVFEMRPVDQEKLSHLAADAKDAVQGADVK